MNALAFTHVNAQPATRLQSARQHNLATAQALGAAVGLIGGAAAPLLGALLIAAGWFMADDAVGHWLSTTGSVLLYLTIPLIILAAYCLDYAEREKP